MYIIWIALCIVVLGFVAIITSVFPGIRTASPSPQKGKNRKTRTIRFTFSSICIERS